MIKKIILLFYLSFFGIAQAENGIRVKTNISDPDFSVLIAESRLKSYPNNFKIAKKVLVEYPHLSYLIGDKLKSNQELAMIVAKNWGGGLIYFDKKVFGNQQLMYAAIQSDYLTAYSMDDKLKKDKVFARRILSSPNWQALYYFDESIREDKEIKDFLLSKAKDSYNNTDIQNFLLGRMLSATIIMMKRK